VKHGEVFLKGAREAVRLRWDEGEAGQARLVSEGTYRVFGYRLVEGDWMLSTTGGRRELEVVRAQPQRLEPSAALHLALRARRQRGGVRVQVQITNGQGQGVTLYQHGKRVPLTYTLLDAEGGELAAGPLRYG
jgi:hypothetical protein